MNASALAARPIEDLLDLIIRSLGLDLVYRVVAPGVGNAVVRETELSGAASPPSSRVELQIELSGPDASLLTAHNGELLHAIEHIAAKILNLEAEEHDRISIDADGFKQHRNEGLHFLAQEAIGQVRATGKAYEFPPMTSRERRLLHLELQGSGLQTASSGDGPRRFVVLYPADAVRKPVSKQGSDVPTAIPSAVATPARVSHLRSAFRPR